MSYLKSKDGCSIYYETHGFESHKPVVVFLNGTTQTTLYWYSLADALKFRFRVLVYDGRGQGVSDIGRAKLSLERHVEDLEGLLQHLGIQKANLVGLSHGAYVALAFASKKPASIGRLILCSVSAKATYRARLTIRSWLEVLRNGEFEAMAWAALPYVFGENYLRHKEKNLERIVKTIVRRNNKDALVAHLEAIHTYPSLRQIVKDLHPTLVISGSDDPLVTADGAQQLAEICGGRHEEIAGVGHSIPVEAPEQFNDMVIDFLSEE
jgi:pimeloyl-ACP methyl ester carboxylesterase